MALPRPSPSEVDLYNLGTAARLAYVIDALLAVVTAVGGTVGITPVNIDASVVAVGNTPVTAFSGPNKGGYITNPLNAAGQGVAAENLYVSLTGNPGSTDAALNNNTFAIAPGGTFIVPAMAAGVNLKVNAATGGHKFAGTKYT